MTHTFLLILIASLLTLSQITLFIYPTLGIIFSAILLYLFLIFAVYDVYDLDASETLASVSALPLLVLVTLSLTIQNSLVNGLVIESTLLIFTFYFLYKAGFIKNVASNTSRYMTRFLGVIAGLSLAFVASIALPLVNQSQNQQVLLLFFFMCISALATTLYFHTLIQSVTTHMTEELLGIVFTTILFAIFHASSNVFVNIINILIGLIGSIIHAFTRSRIIVLSYYLTLYFVFYLLTKSILHLR